MSPASPDFTTREMRGKVLRNTFVALACFFATFTGGVAAAKSSQPVNDTVVTFTIGKFSDPVHVDGWMHGQPVSCNFGLPEKRANYFDLRKLALKTPSGGKCRHNLLSSPVFTCEYTGSKKVVVNGMARYMKVYAEDRGCNAGLPPNNLHFTQDRELAGVNFKLRFINVAYYRSHR